MAKKTYVSNYGTSMRRLMGAQKVKDLKLEIEDGDEKTLISGKAFTLLAGSTSESVGTFEFTSREVKDVRREDYQGQEAIVIEAVQETMYGKKNLKVILPNVKNSNEAYDTLLSFKQKNELEKASGARPVSTGARPISNGSRPVPPSAANRNSNGVRPAPTPAPEPAAAPAPAPTPAPAPAPAPQPAPTSGQYIQPSPSVAMSEQLKAEEPAPAVVPTATPVPAPTPSPVGSSVLSTQQQAPSSPQADSLGSALLNNQPAPAPTPAPAEADNASFEDKLKKIEVMHEMGVMSDDDYKSKKLELLCKEKGLDKFYEKIQKILVAKSTGLMTEEDFAGQVKTVVDPCFDANVNDLEEFKSNVAMIPVIRVSGLVSDSECDKLTDNLLDGIAYDESNTNEQFILNLKKEQILRDAEIISEEEYKEEIGALKLGLNPKDSDDRDQLKAKLGRWPAMVEAGVITSEDFEAKRNRLIADVDGMASGDTESLKAKIKKLMLLKECDWVKDDELASKKAEIIGSISANADEVVRMQLHKVAVEGGLETDAEYDAAKNAIVSEVTAPVNGDMDLFKKRIELLTRIHDAGIISDAEFADFKTKLLDL